MKWYAATITSEDASYTTVDMSQALSVSVQNQVQLRFLCPADIDHVKQLCKEWFPIE